PTTVVEPGMDVAAATTIIKGAGRCGPPTKPRRLIGIERGDQPPGAASICGCLFDLLLLLFIFFICGFGVTTSFRSCFLLLLGCVFSGCLFFGLAGFTFRFFSSFSFSFSLSYSIVIFFLQTRDLRWLLIYLFQIGRASCR